MSTTLDRPTHGHWQDWVSIGLGCFIVASPWLAGNGDSQPAVLNAFTVGIVIASVGSLELSALQRWQEWIEASGGLWFAVSPWILGYSELWSLAVLQVLLGAAVVVLAGAELWQDRDGIPPVRAISG